MTPAPDQKNQIRILIVEDEGIVAADLQQKLQRMSYDAPSIAATGNRALELVKETQPDLVLMDIKIQGSLDGIGTAEIIRQTYDVPFIFVSGNTDNRTLQRAKLTQPHGFIVKPINERELQATIEMALYKHSIEKRLRESEKRYRHLVENSSDIIYRTDFNGNLTYFNEASARSFGYTVEELTGKIFTELIHPEQRDAAKKFYYQQFTEKIIDTYYEFPAIDKNGLVIWLEQSVHLELYENQIVGFHAVARNINERKLAEDKLKQRANKLAIVNESLNKLAITDDLTNLTNRRGLFLLSDQHLKNTQRISKECLIMFIDLDGLKTINDTFGHDEGNFAIARTADILRDSFRASDIIARVGGDEFVVLSAIMHNEDSEIIKSRLQAKLKNYNEKANRGYTLSFSIGLSHFAPDCKIPLEKIVAEADRSMYEHKLKSRKSC
jgi:diguanylate cyclase (GGDEF)-like protein/PAS domain S-box-containing protein